MKHHGTIPTLVPLVCLGASLLAAQQAPRNDSYFYMVQSNKAQIVMLEETGLVPQPLAGKIAGAMKRTIGEAQEPGVERSSDYLDFEEKLIELIGAEASNLHMGRSRIDLGATTERSFLRQATLDVLEKSIAARGKLIELAAKHENTVIAGYTHAVQAQPTTLAHFLLAFASAMERDEQRLREAYGRINQSPLGSAAFATSGFALDRDRLAGLLGFQGVVENAYDATGLSTVDTKAEFASALAIAALNLSRFAQYLVIQYADPQPGMMLADELTGHSSIMPQKRNPGEVERLRYVSGAVAGDAQTVWMVAHSTPPGDVGDVRTNLLRHALAVSANAGRMYDTLGTILEGLVIRPEVTLSIVDSDYSTMTELADTLMRVGRVPFRTGHHVASELTTYGRENGKRPKDLTFGEVAQVFQNVTGQPLPLTESQIREALSAEHIVANRKGKGGPQREEVRRMLANHRIKLRDGVGWVKVERERITAAYQDLEKEFNKLIPR